MLSVAAQGVSSPIVDHAYFVHLSALNFASVPIDFQGDQLVLQTSSCDLH